MFCDEIMDWIDSASEQELRLKGSSGEIAEHLEKCSECRSYYRMSSRLQSGTRDKGYSLWPRFIGRLRETAEKDTRRMKWTLGIASAVMAIFIGIFVIFSVFRPEQKDNSYLSDSLDAYTMLAMESADYQFEETYDELDYYTALSMDY